MTINATDFRQEAINPALAALAVAGIPVSQVAADLIMATCAMESALGTWLSQISGPALGVGQIDPTSLMALVANMTAQQADALDPLMGFSSGESLLAALTRQINGNLTLSCAITRLYYWQVAAPLPADTVSGLWGYYKEWYNTATGAATEAEFVAALKLTDLGNLPE
jgi:hypothetical protein